MATVEEFAITTPKGHSLVVSKFGSENQLGTTLVISSATGVLQGYYSKFGKYFAKLGYVVYTFDYLGIGKSGSEISILKQNTNDLKSWGRNDQAAIVKYAKEHHPENRLVLLTHSVGGQIIGFNPNYTLLDKIVMVGSQSGYWKYFKGIHLPKMFLFWYAMVPILTPMYGYFPAKKLGLFENLPKDMAYEWMKWGKRKKYMMHFYNPKEYFFNKISVPILSLSFPRDDFAPRQAVDWLTDQFVNAKTDRIHHVPPRHKLPHLRHFGFFRERFEEDLWQLTHEWIQK